MKSQLIRILSLFYFLSSLLFVNAQDHTLDSLNKLLKTKLHDTSRINIYIALSENAELEEILTYSTKGIELIDGLIKNKRYPEFKTLLQIKKATLLNNIGFYYQNHSSNNDKALESYIEAYKTLDGIENEALAITLNNIGFTYQIKGELSLTLDYYYRCLAILQKLNNKFYEGILLNNIGQVNFDLGNISAAIEYYEKSLKMQEELNNLNGIALAMNNLGAVYDDQGDKTKAMEYYLKGVKLYKEAKNKKGMADALNNVAYIHQFKKEYEKAINDYTQSLKLYEEVAYSRGIANVLKNIGTIFLIKKDFNTALSNFQKSLNIYKEYDDKKGQSFAYNNLGTAGFDLHKFQNAYAYCDSSLQLAKRAGFIENIRNAEGLLAQIDSAKANYQGAFSHYKNFILYRDSLMNEKTRKASIKSQLKYEFEKKEAVIKEQQEKERMVAEEKSRFQQIVITIVSLGLLLVIGLAGFIYRTLKTTRLQKLIIEEKQKEILDSIHYAKKIQTALLTNESYIDKNLSRLAKKNN